MTTLFRVGSLSLAIAALTACGGGSDGSIFNNQNYKSSLFEPARASATTTTPTVPNQDSSTYTTAAAISDLSQGTTSENVAKSYYTAKTRDSLHSDLKTAYGDRFETTFTYTTKLTKDGSDSTITYRNNQAIDLDPLGYGHQVYTMNETDETYIDGKKYTGDRTSRIQLYQQENSIVLGRQTLSGVISDGTNTKNLSPTSLRIDQIKGNPYKKPSVSDISSAKETATSTATASTTAQTAVTTAQTAVTTAQAAVTTAQAKVTAAQTAYSAAQSSVTAAQAALAAATSDEAKAAAQTTLTAAESDAATKLTAVTTAQAEVTTAQAAVTTAQATLATAQETAATAATEAATAQTTLANLTKQNEMFTKGLEFSYKGEAFNQNSTSTNKGTLDYHINFNTRTGHGSITGLDTGKINLNNANMVTITHQNPDEGMVDGSTGEAINSQLSMLGIQGVANFDDKRADGTYTLGIFGDYATEIAGVVTENNVNTVGFGGVKVSEK